MRKWLPLAVVVAILLVIGYAFTSPSANAGGLPEADGVYSVQTRAVSYDGDAYRFIWFDDQNNGHQARSTDVQLQQDDKSFLEMKDGEPVLHLAPDEPVSVQGRDDHGSFTSSWFPFMVGYAMGGGFTTGPPTTIDRTPSYRYPPTDGITRDGTAFGNTASSTREKQDFNKATAPINAVGGKNSGAGGGTAATNKSSTSGVTGGQSGGAGAGAAATSKSSSSAPAASGQSGGTGTGSAATSKTAPKPSIGGKAPSGLSTGKKPSLSLGGKRR